MARGAACEETDLVKVNALREAPYGLKVQGTRFMATGLKLFYLIVSSARGCAFS